MRGMRELDPDANKYTRGTVSVIGGSAAYSGAPILSALAAARTGAGYVSLAVPAAIAGIAQSHLLSIPVVTLPGCDGVVGDGAFPALTRTLAKADSVAVGMGMPPCAESEAFLVECAETVECPLLLDAGALDMLAGHASASLSGTLAEAVRGRGARGAHTVLTPHAAELERLLEGLGIVTDGLRYGEAAARLADALSCVVVAKGSVTHITDGGSIDSSDIGGPELACAGTGDVLAGVIASLIAQDASASIFEQAKLGVHIHSLAGMVMRESLGDRSGMAEDLVECIPRALSLVRRT